MHTKWQHSVFLQWKLFKRLMKYDFFHLVSIWIDFFIFLEIFLHFSALKMIWVYENYFHSNNGNGCIERTQSHTVRIFAGVVQLTFSRILIDTRDRFSLSHSLPLSVLNTNVTTVAHTLAKLCSLCLSWLCFTDDAQHCVRIFLSLFTCTRIHAKQLKWRRNRVACTTSHRQCNWERE